MNACCPSCAGRSDDNLICMNCVAPLKRALLELPELIVADLVNAQHQAVDDEIDRKIYADAPDSIKARLRCFNNGDDV